jgi:thiamine pyrophosphate-dependent acetolactate synthase large subunit-like protein
MESAPRRGHRKLLEQLRADGITYIFGNPGSSEEGLLDELSRFSDITYILGLQEAAIVAVADAYAQATRKPAVVQLHSGVGLGNGTSGLYHALKKRTPMVVMAGEAGVEADALEAHMAIDLVALARPVTKYAARAIHSGSVLRLLRRCMKVAATPPCGPVFLAIPQDVLDQPNDEPVRASVALETRVAPEPDLLARAARLLAAAETPVILVGDGVAQAGAHGELAALAVSWGARVYGLMASEVCLPWTHPLFCGLTGHMFGDATARAIGDADAALLCGTYAYPEVFPLLQDPLAGVPIVHIDLNSYDIAKNHPVTLGLVADPKVTLAGLSRALNDEMTGAQRSAARARAERIGADNDRARKRAMEADRARASSSPLHMATFAAELARQAPKDVVIYDEALTHSPELTRWLPPPAPGSLFQTPGGTLGVGIPGAVGLKLAHPQRTVIGFTGDGGAMYTLQSMWTAAHYGVGAKFVVCNNRSYRLLKENLADYWRHQSMAGVAFPAAFDILIPEIDFVGLAKALGVPGQRVAAPSAVAPAIAAMLASEGPYLLELILERDVSP